MKESVTQSKEVHRLSSKNTTLRFCDQSVIGIPDRFSSRLFGFVNWVDNVNWRPYKDSEADVSSVSPSQKRIEESTRIEFLSKATVYAPVCTRNPQVLIVICCIHLHIYHMSRIPFLVLGFLDFFA